MNDETLGSYSGWEIAAVFAGGVFFSLVVAVALLFAAGQNTAILGALIAQSVGSLGILWLIARLRERPPESLAFVVQPGDALYLGAGIALQIVLAVVFYPLTSWLVGEKPVQNLQPVIEAAQGQGARLLLILGIVILAPLTEEVVFRGALLFRLARNRGARWGTVMSAAIFSVLHAGTLAGSDLTGMTRSAAAALPQLFAVGLVFGWLTVRSQRLGPAIFTHIGFNLLTVVILLAAPGLDRYL